MPALRAIAVLAAQMAAAAAPPPFPDPTTVLHELNVLRADPGAYAAELRQIATGYRGVYYREGDGTEHASHEGAGAVSEAATALSRQAPLPALASDPILQAAARDQVEAQGATGLLGHASAAGATPGERVRRRGGDIYVTEAIVYGMHDAADAVRSLVIDDGVPGRGHRRLLLSPIYRYAGVWCGAHVGQGTMCVVDLASEPGGRPHVPGN